MTHACLTPHQPNSPEVDIAGQLCADSVLDAALEALERACDVLARSLKSMQQNRVPA